MWEENVTYLYCYTSCSSTVTCFFLRTSCLMVAICDRIAYCPSRLYARPQQQPVKLANRLAVKCQAPKTSSIHIAHNKHDTTQLLLLYMEILHALSLRERGCKICPYEYLCVGGVGYNLSPCNRLVLMLRNHRVMNNIHLRWFDAHVFP